MSWVSILLSNLLLSSMFRELSRYIWYFFWLSGYICHVFWYFC